MKFEPIEIPDVVLVTSKVLGDERGYFMETFKESVFREAGIVARFVQDNQSKSGRGVLRGLHYQVPPAAQAKLVRVLSGEIFDVAVDIRKGSPNYGRWAGRRLSEENRKMLFIPEGFAHGFVVLSDTAEVAYKTSAEYSPEHDRGIAWDDPDIGVEWPLAAPVLSAKDRSLPRLRDAGADFAYAG